MKKPQPNILVVDGMNFLHRARSGWQLGQAPVVFNFFRNLRALVEKFEPSRVYFVLEGHPQQRKDVLPEYKANRIVEEGTPKHEELKKFFAQVDVIVDAMTKCFPVSVVRHARYECDDTIYNLIKRSSTAVPWTVASSDTDFIQLLNEFEHVKLYNPMKKEFVECPAYDYVHWKALRGDGSDNIPGIPGIGDKRAEQYLENSDELEKLFSNPDNARIFERNVGLIKFIEWSDEDAAEMTSSSPSRDWGSVRQLFERYEFTSLLKDASWTKFVNTFDHLFGE